MRNGKMNRLLPLRRLLPDLSRVCQAFFILSRYTRLKINYGLKQAISLPTLPTKPNSLLLQTWLARLRAAVAARL